jgi:hypothetical protein
MLEKEKSDIIFSLLKSFKEGNINRIDDYIEEIEERESGDLGRYKIRKRLLELEPRTNLWVYFALLVISESGDGLSKSYFLEKIKDIKYALTTDNALDLFDGYKRLLFYDILSNPQEFDKFILFNKISISLKGKGK